VAFTETNYTGGTSFRHKKKNSAQTN